jgi:hypothetical protein
MSFYVELKMHDGTFGTYSSGYETLEKAKAAAARVGRGSPYNARVVRVVEDDAVTCLEARFEPRARAKWVRLGLDGKT